MQKSAQITAFTLVEILVAMAIAGAVIAAGIGGFQSFRQTIQFQQAYLAVVAQLQTTQNMARNSVSSHQLELLRATDPSGSMVDGYALFFNAANYNLQYCLYPGATKTGPIDCSGTEQSNLKIAEYADVNVTPSTAACTGIFFERLTGDIAAMANLNTNLSNSATDCVITVTHAQNSGLTGSIGINMRTNNIYEI